MLPLPVAAGAPAPLGYAAYDGWNAIRTPQLSEDGRSLAYALTPEDGDPTLVVRDLVTGTERRETRGSAPRFAAGGRFVVYTHVAAKRDVDAAKKAKKPESQQPKNGIGILDLRGTGAALVVDDVKTIVVAKRGGPVIAYRAEPKPAPSAAPSPAASASPSPKADKKKDQGSTLTIRDLLAGTQITADDVTDVAVSDDDRFVAYATATKPGARDGVHVYDAARKTTLDVLTGEGRYRDLALARDGSALAFLSDVATYRGDVPHDAAYVVDLRAAAPKAVMAVDAGSAGMTAGTTPSANGTLTFSRDGKRVFLGVAAAPTPLPSGTPEPMKVDQWSWNDDALQSSQKHDADQDRKRTYRGVYDIAAARYAQLGSATLRDVQTNENPQVALGSDDRPYRRAASWTGEERSDLYAVSLADGKRTLLTRGATPQHALSPEGGFVVSWDEQAKHWIALSTRGGARVVLAPQAPVAFADRSDDHPAPPPPFGIGGWLSGDRGVLLYDRYDIWVADPRTGAATMLTRGAGRRTHTVYSALQTDPDADAFAANAPLLLAQIDDRTYASGFARVAAGGGVPQSLLRADALVNEPSRDIYEGLHDRVKPPLVSRDGSRYAFTESTYRAFPDLYAADASLRAPVRVTDANPQQAAYRWGSEHVLTYRAKDGTPLHAIELVPDGLRRDRSAPMLVYFYERWSDTLHSYYTPGPGTSPSLSRYVSNGYVVLLPDVRYRVGHPGASAENCILPAVDAALASGYVDPAHVGIAGHSWAAYQINDLITRTHRFRAVEAGAAVDDMVSAYGGIRLESGNVREAQYEHGQSRIGYAPWERPDLYLENSGLFHIANVTTPYLTIHNDLDGAVPQFQGIEWITAMRRLGKEAYLFSFDGEDHNLKGREQQKFWTVHLDEWFDHWLKGAPRPSWMNGVDYLHRGERDVRPLYGEKD